MLKYIIVTISYILFGSTRTGIGLSLNSTTAQTQLGWLPWAQGIIASRDDLDPFMDSQDEMSAPKGAVACKCSHLIVIARMFIIYP